MAHAMTTKIALNIDRNLVASAAQILGTSGTTATIDAALVTWSSGQRANGY
jgi:Arc/MetJ family transcription regulator